MKLINKYTFPGFIFQQYNTQSELMVCLTVIANYDLTKEGRLAFVDTQPEIKYMDSYELGEEGGEYLSEPSDFVPYKPGTDVTFLGNSYSPTGEAKESWPTGIKIEDFEHLIHVYGARNWEPSLSKGWKMGPAVPCLSVPLSWEKAFGGLIPHNPEKEDTKDYHRYNPLGTGLLNKDYSNKHKFYPAPQIEHPKQPITDWSVNYIPQCFAPVAPVWRFREQYTGTYDETWLKTRHPFLPQDFDYRFYQCAHPDLILPFYLKGDERFQFACLYPGIRRYTSQLPKLKFTALTHYMDGSKQEHALNLDGLHFNLLGENRRLKLTWRIMFGWGEGVESIEVKPQRIESERSL